MKLKKITFYFFTTVILLASGLAVHITPVFATTGCYQYCLDQNYDPSTPVSTQCNNTCNSTTHLISGTITDRDNNPLQGASIKTGNLNADSKDPYSNLSTPTDQNGHYAFSVEPGTYSISATFKNETETFPPIQITNSDFASANIQMSYINTSTPTPTPIENGVVQGYVWNDTHQLISGAQVTAHDSSGKQVGDAQTTTSDGHYSFTLPNANYTIKAEYNGQTAERTDATARSGGLFGVTSSEHISYDITFSRQITPCPKNYTPNPGQLSSPCIEVTPSLAPTPTETVTNQILLKSSPTPSSTPSTKQTYYIQGDVFIDNNNNGSFDNGDTFVSNTGITISTSDTSIDLSNTPIAITDAYGHYRTSKLPNGAYTLTVSLPGGSTQTEFVTISNKNAEQDIPLNKTLAPSPTSTQTHFIGYSISTDNFSGDDPNGSSPQNPTTLSNLNQNDLDVIENLQNLTPCQATVFTVRYFYSNNVAPVDRQTTVIYDPNSSCDSATVSITPSSNANNSSQNWTCYYSQKDDRPTDQRCPGGDNAVEYVTGTGCSGFNCQGCSYTSGVSEILCTPPNGAASQNNNNPSPTPDNNAPDNLNKSTTCTYSEADSSCSSGLHVVTVTRCDLTSCSPCQWVDGYSTTECYINPNSSDNNNPSPTPDNNNNQAGSQPTDTPTPFIASTCNYSENCNGSGTHSCTGTEQNGQCKYDPSVAPNCGTCSVQNGSQNNGTTCTYSETCNKPDGSSGTHSCTGTWQDNVCKYTSGVAPNCGDCN